MNKEKINKIYTQAELHFYWRAYNKNGEIINQFKELENGELEEINFREIDIAPEKFNKFELVNTDNPDIKFSVDLVTGNFNLNGVVLKNNIDIKDCQLRCIFWRNKSVSLNIAIKSESLKYNHYTLGWATTKDKISLKREYKIFPDLTVQEIFNKKRVRISAKANIVKK